MSILAIGPSSKKFSTGQSVHFESVCRKLDNVSVLYYTKYNFVLLDALILVLHLIRCRVLKNYNIIYYTPSRTNGGIIRDLLILAILTIGKTNIKTYGHVHGSELVEFFYSASAVTKSMTRWVYNQHSETFVLSDTIGRQISSALKVSTQTIYNTLDLDENFPDFSGCKTDSKVNLLWCSNLIYSKGFTYFADSILALPDSYLKSCRLTIIGKVISDRYKTQNEMNDLVNDYLRRFREKSINYKYLGALENRHVMKFYNSSDIFILPSFYDTEAMPISVMEAIKGGTKVILSDWKSLKEIFGEYRINFVEPRNSISLSDALIRDIDDKLSGQLNKDLLFNFRLLAKNCTVNNDLLMEYFK